MAVLWKGAPVAAALVRQTQEKLEALRARSVSPCLAIVRVGERPDDLSYERAAAKRCEGLGIGVRRLALPDNLSFAAFASELDTLNRDASIHGILLLRPLPPQLKAEGARNLIAPEKDVDGCTDVSLSGIITGAAQGFPPCTARAVMELLRFYGFQLRGCRAAVVGRSLVVGRPLALLLTEADATVTLCHSRTEDLPALLRGMDLVVSTVGKPALLGADCFRSGQTVVDVGVSWNEQTGALCGDVDFSAAESFVSAITPVPGGVGSVTTAVLALQTAEAAQRSLQ